ncbi:hypothetical protein PO909_022520 [Leuciscus waleckii]
MVGPRGNFCGVGVGEQWIVCAAEEDATGLTPDPEPSHPPQTHCTEQTPEPNADREPEPAAMQEPEIKMEPTIASELEPKK